MENSETRKRKLDDLCMKEREKEQEEEEDDDDEEEKMEKFFALIRSTREIRDHMRRASNIGFKERDGDIRVEEDNIKGASITTPPWNPSFQPEDFAVDVNHYRAGPSKKEHVLEEKEDINNKQNGQLPVSDGGNGGLDLRLSL